MVNIIFPGFSAWTFLWTQLYYSQYPGRHRSPGHFYMHSIENCYVKTNLHVYLSIYFLSRVNLIENLFFDFFSFVLSLNRKTFGNWNRLLRDLPTLYIFVSKRQIFLSFSDKKVLFINKKKRILLSTLNIVIYLTSWLNIESKMFFYRWNNWVTF